MSVCFCFYPLSFGYLYRFVSLFMVRYLGLSLPLFGNSVACHVNKGLGEALNVAT